MFSNFSIISRGGIAERGIFLKAYCGEVFIFVRTDPIEPLAIMSSLSDNIDVVAFSSLIFRSLSPAKPNYFLSIPIGVLRRRIHASALSVIVLKNMLVDGGAFLGINVPGEYFRGNCHNLSANLERAENPCGFARIDFAKDKKSWQIYHLRESKSEGEIRRVRAMHPSRRGNKNENWNSSLSEAENFRVTGTTNEAYVSRVHPSSQRS